MKHPSRFFIAYKALLELGFNQVSLYGIYRLGLLTGHYQRLLSQALSHLDRISDPEQLKLQKCLPQLPDRDAMLALLGDQVHQLYAQADDIVDGKVCLFGGAPVPLILDHPQPLMDWTAFENSKNLSTSEDIKLTWEPARFGWACTLAMAYYLSHNEAYAGSFWCYVEHFLSANPPFLGPHWISAQEAAIRIIVFAFAYHVFKDSSQTTPERAANLARSIAIHAERIPPTMVYARSQNNNHLVTEALGLYTASALLPAHPQASRWHRLGWKWLLHAFRTQIEVDGSYIQHSTNYHRLMLQAAIWAVVVQGASFPLEPIPDDLSSRFQAATHWLWKIIDPDSGGVPNLGHNDGAYILPLTVQPYQDFRPVLNAAQRVFLQQDPGPQAAWKDMGSWLTGSLHLPIETGEGNTVPSYPVKASNQAPHTILNEKSSSWAYFRIASYHSRPGHADQLNLDLWWKSVNLAIDPGTYLYNAPPPWDNSLTNAAVHNTVTVDGLDTMRKVSRFLYLDWANAKVDATQTSSSGGITSLTAHHDGYRRLRIVHTRTVTALEDGQWEIIDRLEGPTNHIHAARLHWLLPNWEYEILEESERTNYTIYKVKIRSPYGWVTIEMGQASQTDDPIPAQNVSLQIVRAGVLLSGSGEANPIDGWVSPTYGEKLPALACSLKITQAFPITFNTRWILPE